MRIAILVFSLVIAFSPAAFAQTPTGIIFDTDMGNDVDDALALAMLHAFQSRHEINLLAVTVTKDNKWAAPYVDVVNTSTDVLRSQSVRCEMERRQSRIR